MAHWCHTLGVLPPPLWGRGGEGGGCCGTRCVKQTATPPLAHSHKGEGNTARRVPRLCSQTADHQLMMFSANHLRHSTVFSARSLWSMMIACLFHCSAEVNTPGSLATAGSTLASSTTGLPFLNLATSACTCGSSVMLMNL